MHYVLRGLSVWQFEMFLFDIVGLCCLDAELIWMSSKHVRSRFSMSSCVAWMSS